MFSLNFVCPLVFYVTQPCEQEHTLTRDYAHALTMSSEVRLSLESFGLGLEHVGFRVWGLGLGFEGLGFRVQAQGSYQMSL